MAWFFLATMLFCNLIAVGAFGYVASNNAKYREGLLHGVHIPAERLKEAELLAITEGHRRRWRLWSIGNLVFAVGSCFLVFPLKVEEYIMIWYTWIIVYLVVSNLMIVLVHYRLYRLKTELGWVDPKSVSAVRVDTVASTAPRKRVSFLWQLLVLAVFAVTLPVYSRLSDDPGMKMFYLASAGVGLLFLVFHIFLEQRGGNVYSEDSSVNIQADEITRYSWTLGMLLGGICNAAAWCALLLMVYISGWVGAAEIGVYSLMQLIAGFAAFLPICIGAGRRRELLARDERPLLTDDDEYWKYGFYYNPGDRRTFVPDRMSPMSISYNLARPAGKLLYGGTAVLIIGATVVLFWVMLAFHDVKIEFVQDGGQYRVHAAMYTWEFEASEVVEVTLLEQMPEGERFYKENGASTDDYDIGNYRGQVVGACRMYVIHNGGPVIEVKLEGETLYLTGNTEKETDEWYRRLTNKTLAV